MSQRSFIALTCFALASACVGEPQEPSAPVGGLRIFDQHATDVAGTFTRGDAGIDFAFTVDGTKHTATIRSADGRPLIESTFADGVETTTYLGRVTVRGLLTEAASQVSGDRATLAELAELPEAQLVEPLRQALDQRGVAKDLYAIPPQPAGRRCVSWSWWARCDAQPLVSKL